MKQFLRKSQVVMYNYIELFCKTHNRSPNKREIYKGLNYSGYTIYVFTRDMVSRGILTQERVGNKVYLTPASNSAEV